MKRGKNLSPQALRGFLSLPNAPVTLQTPNCHNHAPFLLPAQAQQVLCRGLSTTQQPLALFLSEQKGLVQTSPSSSLHSPRLLHTPPPALQLPLLGLSDQLQPLLSCRCSPRVLQSPLGCPHCPATSMPSHWGHAAPVHPYKLQAPAGVTLSVPSPAPPAGACGTQDYHPELWLCGHAGLSHSTAHESLVATEAG